VGGELASGVLTVLEDHGVTWALSLRCGPLCSGVKIYRRKK
jgi:hypothetical protein